MNWTVINQKSKGPCGRWGHATVVYQEQLYLFGGYDSNYLNDFYSFDFETKSWAEVKTYGVKPEPRSNHLMCVHQHYILIHGGGGIGRYRFGDLHLLNMHTMTWEKMSLQTLQRTYHAGCIGDGKLYLFGGESGMDVDHLEIVDLKAQTLLHCQPLGTTRPERRRFATLEFLNGSVYLLGGCTQQYVPCEAIFRGTLRGEDFRWEDAGIKYNKWGHSSAVFQNQIYCFGGRDVKDSDEIAKIDVAAGKLTKLSDAQIKPRRKHSCSLLGNSMIIFGGFNGQYLKDFGFFEIPLFEFRDVQVKELAPRDFELLFDEAEGIKYVNASFDTIISTLDYSFGVARASLCQQSGYFLNMFQGDYQEQFQKVIYLDQFDSNAMAVILLFCEKGELILPMMNEQELFALLSAAEYLDMHTLKSDLKTYVGKTLEKFQNVMSLYRLSIEHQDDQLQRYCAFHLSSMEEEPLAEINNFQKEQVNQIRKIRKLSLLK